MGCLARDDFFHFEFKGLSGCSVCVRLASDTYSISESALSESEIPSHHSHFHSQEILLDQP